MWTVVTSQHVMFTEDPLIQSSARTGAPHSQCGDGQSGPACHPDDSSFILDLKAVFTVEYVMLYNREDCCLDSIIGAVIELLSKSDGVLYTCGTVTEARADYNVSCGNKYGRKIRVRHLKGQHLEFEKIDIFGSPAPTKKVIISKGKPTWMSSMLAAFYSSLAVDGSYVNNQYQNSFNKICFQSNQENNPFWTVDLQGTFNIDHVVLYNRVDCCTEILIGAVVELLSVGGKMRHTCGKITEFKTIYNISCGNKGAQKVRVRGTAEKYLHLCEVEVFGSKESGSSNPQLISRRKPTFGSSVNQGLDSSLAVDGNFNNMFNGLYLKANCFHTQNDDVPYWIVDLQGTFNIDHVVLYNRMDCCSEQVIGAVVQLLTVHAKLIHECGKITELKPVYNISCGNVNAQMVRIRGAAKHPLHLCEVDVVGDLINKSPMIISRGKPTKQSSVLWEFHSSLAVDGKYENHVVINSQWQRNCFHTNEDKMPFWMVGLQGTFNIDHVSLYNRMDHGSDRIIGAVVELLNRNEEVVHVCSKITESKPFYYIPCGNKNAEKVRVKGTPNRSLNLCEVDVFGDRLKQ